MDLTKSWNNCKPETYRQQNITSQLSSTHVLFSNITSIKRYMQTQREPVTSTSTWKSRGTYFTMVWFIEYRATDSSHKTCDDNTSLPSVQKKISHKEALNLTTRQNNCKPGKMSKQKIDFQICLTHVLFPNITSIKRQMQRQERTGHFHVNSKEEWNIFYDGVNDRAQSNRQFTQDLRQWH